MSASYENLPFELDQLTHDEESCLMSKPEFEYQRTQATELQRRLDEPRRWIQVVTGARQVGKTTLVQQVTGRSDRSVRFVSADEPMLRGREWLVQQWDEDTRKRIPLKIVLLGSAHLLLHQGLTESLAGRFETLHLPHWSWPEMHEAFGFLLDQYLYFGGYPGAARWPVSPSDGGATCWMH